MDFKEVLPINLVKKVVIHKEKVVINHENIAEIIFENNSSPLHSLEWNLAKEQHGQQFIYFSYQTNDSQAAFPIVIKRKGPIKIGWVPYGIPFKGDRKKILKELKKVLRSNGILSLVTIGYNFFNTDTLEQHFHKVPFIRHNLSTFTLDLKSLDEESLLDKFNSTTRKHVRKASKEGFSIEEMTFSDYSKFYTLYEKLCALQGFPPVCSLKFLQSLVETTSSSPNPKFKVVGLKAVKEGIHYGYLIGLINGRVLLEFLRADDSAVDTKGHERKLLTYKLIASAIHHGVELYDFGGVVLNDEGKGIFNFKKGFGGELVHSTRYKFSLCI